MLVAAAYVNAGIAAPGITVLAGSPGDAKIVLAATAGSASLSRPTAFSLFGLDFIVGVYGVVMKEADSGRGVAVAIIDVLFFLLTVAVCVGKRPPAPCAAPATWARHCTQLHLRVPVAAAVRSPPPPRRHAPR